MVTVQNRSSTERVLRRLRTRTHQTVLHRPEHQLLLVGKLQLALDEEYPNEDPQYQNMTSDPPY